MQKKYITPSFIQFEATECGAVSLYIILGFYGKWCSLEHIRELCKVGRNGANLGNTAKAATRLGLEVELFNYTPAEIRSNFSSPCIIFWNKNHFLVLEGFEGSKVFLSDPARGRRTVDIKLFEQSFSKFCLTLTPGNEFVKSGKPPSQIDRIIDLLGKDKIPGILLSFALGIVTAIPTIGIAAISTFFTQRVITNVSDSNNGYIWILLFLTFLTFLSAELMYMIQRRLQASVNEGILDKFFKKVFAMPLSFYSLRDLGELANRVTISPKLSSTLTGPLANASVAAMQIVIYALALLFFSNGLTLLVIAIIGLIVSFTNKYLNEVIDLSARSAISNGRMASTLLYITSNSEQVKGNGLESQLFSKWADDFAEYTNASSRTSLVSQYATAGSSMMNNLSDYFIILSGGILILVGKISLAEFVGMRIITQGMFAPINTATSVITALKSLTGDINRLFDVFDNTEDPICIEIEDSINDFNLNNTAITSMTIDKQTLPQHDFKLHQASISVSNLNYRFPGDTSNVIEDINILFPAGKITAICGPSGCGKSTLLRIIAGLINPTSGQVSMDEVEISNIPKDEFFTDIAYNDTEIYIMNDSVFNNVTLFDPSYDREDVLAALVKASLKKVIDRLPHGVDHILQADGDDLSGGQKQRIQLARVFLRNPRIAIIDEGTSALDNETERKVILELCKSTETLIASTHRPSLLSIADQIIMMNSNGHIDSTGTFNELSTHSEEFKQMFMVNH